MTAPINGESEQESRPKVLVVGKPDLPHWVGLNRIVTEAEIVIGDDEATLTEHIQSADVLFIWYRAPSLEPFWSRAAAVRWAHTALAGVDSLLFPAFVQSDVILTNSRGVFGESLAEYALATILYFAKRLPQMAEYQRQRQWCKVRPVDIAGQNVCVLGLGDIGQVVARKAAALGLRVTGLRRHPSGVLPAGVERVLPVERMEEIFAEADYLVMCTPLTTDTRRLVGERELGWLKPGAVLVNIGRGGVLDEVALLAALRSGRLGGAAVDVFEKEPLDGQNPLWQAPNLIISAHTADNVAGWEDRVVDLFVDNFHRYKQDLPLLNLVDKPRGY
jgi:phosphoglycerate dehydrogenase-like enzyme